MPSKNTSILKFHNQNNETHDDSQRYYDKEFNTALRSACKPGETKDNNWNSKEKANTRK